MRFRIKRVKNTSQMWKRWWCHQFWHFDGSLIWSLIKYLILKAVLAIVFKSIITEKPHVFKNLVGEHL